MKTEVSFFVAGDPNFP